MTLPPVRLLPFVVAVSRLRTADTLARFEKVLRHRDVGSEKTASPVNDLRRLIKQARSIPVPEKNIARSGGFHSVSLVLMNGTMAQGSAVLSTHGVTLSVAKEGINQRWEIEMLRQVLPVAAYMGMPAVQCSVDVTSRGANKMSEEAIALIPGASEVSLKGGVRTISCKTDSFVGLRDAELMGLEAVLRRGGLDAHMRETMDALLASLESLNPDPLAADLRQTSRRDDNDLSL